MGSPRQKGRVPIGQEAKREVRFVVSCALFRIVKNTCESFRVEIAQWRICDNLKNRSRTEEGRRRGLWFLIVLEFGLNPALSERAATGWRAEGLSQDATAGRGPSRLRVNKPRPYREKGNGSGRGLSAIQNHLRVRGVCRRRERPRHRGSATRKYSKAKLPRGRRR